MSRLYPTLAAIISSTYHTIEIMKTSSVVKNLTLSGAVLGRSISRLYFAWVKLNFQSLVYQNWNFAARSLDILRNARAITCGIINNRPLELLVNQSIAREIHAILSPRHTMSIPFLSLRRRLFPADFTRRSLFWVYTDRALIFDIRGQRQGTISGSRC